MTTNIKAILYFLKKLLECDSKGQHTLARYMKHYCCFSQHRCKSTLAISDTASMSTTPEHLDLHVIPVIKPILFPDSNFYLSKTPLQPP